MPKYYIKYDSTVFEGREYWLGSNNNQWVDYQCNALTFLTLESAKAAMASVVDHTVSKSFKIVVETTTFDVVFTGDQLISNKLFKLADKAYGYTHESIAQQILEIAKEIKQ